MTLYKWSQIAAADAAADTSINWQEGQAPSSINDSARAMMAATAKYRDDIAGAIVTTGTSTNYAVSSYQSFDSLAHMNGQVIAFSPHITNAGTQAFLNVDGLGIKTIRSAPGVDIQSGTLIAGTPYTAVYNNSDACFYLHGFYGNPFNIPIGGGVDYWGATVPNSSFAFPTGQAISRTTYATLFAIIGTTYGAGDGSTTFNLPDKTGRVSAMKEATATRLTSAVSGVDGATMGSASAAQSKTLLTANLPAYTPAGSISNGAITISGGSSGRGVAGDNNNNGGGGGSFSAMSSSALSLTASQGGSTFAGTAQGGTSAPVSIVQPTIVCNYIIRII